MPAVGVFVTQARPGGDCRRAGGGYAGGHGPSAARIRSASGPAALAAPGPAGRSARLSGPHWPLRLGIPAGNS